jgi:hypothetical protein
LQDLPKCPQIGIFCSKIYRLATLVREADAALRKSDEKKDPRVLPPARRPLATLCSKSRTFAENNEMF